MRIAARGETDIGRTRSTNQDTFLINDECQLYMVADGMGGHAGGEVASQLCVEEVSSWVEEYISSYKEQPTKSKAKDGVRGFEDSICKMLTRAVNNASMRIYERALEEPQLIGMGTTASLLLVLKGYAYIAHVGDSRVYLVRDRFIYQLTNDHSLVNEQLRAGMITAEEVKHSRLSNVITRSVGYQEIEDVDIHTLEVEGSDLYVLSTDGLHGKILDEEISCLVYEKKLNAVDTLIELANERDGKDNITMIVVSAGG